MKVKRIPNFNKQEEFSMVDVSEIPYGIKVKELIEFLKKCNQEAIILCEYDGSVYAPGLPTPVHLEKVWDGCKYTSPNFFVEQTGFEPHENLHDKEYEPGEETAIKWE